MSPEREKWIDRVNAILAQAQSTNNAEERDTFTANAERLIIKHAIEEAELQARQVKPRDEVVQRRLHFTGIFARSHRDLMFRLSEALGFQTVFHHTPYGEKGLFGSWVGHESELDAAEMLLASLQLQIARWMPEAVRLEEEERGWSMDKREKYVYRRSFVENFAYVVGKRIKASRKVIIDEVAASDNSLLPVLADRRTEVDKAVQQFFGKLRSTKAASKEGSRAGAMAGREAGERADINSSARVGSGSRGAIGR